MSITNGNLVETSDNVGSTKAYQGTATTTPSTVPASPGNVISQAGITNTGSTDIQVSFDGGITYTNLLKKEFLSWDVKGQITQLYVKTTTSLTTYDILINFEDF